MAQLLNLEGPYVKVVGWEVARCATCNFETRNICIENDDGGLRCMSCWSEDETKDASQYEWFEKAIIRLFAESLRLFL